MSANDNVNNFVEEQSATPRVDPRVQYLERRLCEAFDEMWDSFVDPAEAVCDGDGMAWNRLGGGPLAGGMSGMPFGDEQQLAQIRDQCRALAIANEFAINGHDYPLS